MFEFLKKLLGSKTAKQKEIGRVTHYFGGIGVAIVKFNKSVQVGANVNFHGTTTDFSQKIDSMQYDHKEVQEAPKNKEIGIKVKSRVREGDGVFESSS